MAKNLPPLSEQYKKEVRNAILSIIFFFIVYIILIILTLGIVALLGYGGILLITATNLNWFTILIAGGILGMSVLLLIFLFKFIFSSRGNDDKMLIEINRNQEPELFTLIDDVVKQVQTQHPKKVFLTTEVNAFVNYNSVFWSMFFPVKKNLTIGLGLINTTTVSELKAILAHEFGHFSQRSMKVGSFVNQANRIIHDMLYNNDGFTKMIDGFASIHGILALFARLSVLIINGIQWVLSKTYDFLFKNHMSLSRQMEFNADAIATTVVGSEVKMASLLRLELSDAAYENSIRFFMGENQNFDTKNIYENQTLLLHHLSIENNHVIKNDLPYINENEISRYDKSKLNIEDQWASHPTTLQRIQAIKKLNIVSENVDSHLAKSIIKNFNSYAENLTNKVLDANGIKRSGSYISEEEFVKEYVQNIEKHSFPKLFNSYYDFKNPILTNFDEIKYGTPIIQQTEIFSDEKVSLVNEKITLENDSKILEMIENGTYPIKTFDYDGKKYTRKQTKLAQNILQERLETVSKDIDKNDVDVFRNLYFLANSQQQEKLLKMQANFNGMDQSYEEFQKSFHDFIPHLNFMSEVHQVEEIPKFRKNLLDQEKIFKENVERLQNSEFIEFTSEEQRKTLENYLKLNQLYFNLGEYLQPEIDLLNNVLGIYQEALQKGYFQIKKRFLEFEAEILIQN